jgi:predicted oxidoreductase
MPLHTTNNDSRTVGTSAGLAPSTFAWGAWRTADDPLFADPAKYADYLTSLIELGVTTIDHADIYGDYQSEKLFGAAIAHRPKLREQLRIVTKTGICLVSAEHPENWITHYNTTAGHISGSCERSLRRLQVDVIDLFLLHRPDPLLNVDETAGALTLLQEQGKVREIGVSNFLPGQVDLLQSRLDSPLVTNQIEFSVLHLEPLSDGTLDQAQRHDRRPMTWSPLAGSDLLFGTTPRHVEVRSVMQRIADELGAGHLSQVALAFILMHPSRPQPILGSNKLQRLRQLRESADLQMSRQQWYAILAASRGSDVP